MSEEGVKLITINEAVRLLALGRSTIYGLIRDGEIPVVKIGRSIRFVRKDLEEWAKRHTRYERKPDKSHPDTEYKVKDE